MNNLQLLICLNSPNEKQGLWTCALEIPTVELYKYSLFPLKWVRYLAYALLGCQGHLSNSTHGIPIDYHFSPVDHTELTGKYYYISEGPYRLIDLQAMDDRFSDSGVSTQSSQAEFRAALVERDERCIITRYIAEDSIACHILPRSKGDEYIKNFSAWRTDGQLVIDNICDCRNGFFMEPLCHTLFASRKLAFLPVPNFALSMADILRDAGSLESGLILQWIKPRSDDDPALIDRHHGKLISIPTEPWKHKQWPPTFLLDAVYGVAAFDKWGTSSFKTELITLAHAYYYGKDQDKISDEEDGGWAAKLAQANVRRAEKNKERADRAARQAGDLDVLDMVTLLWELHGTEKRGSDMRKGGASRVKCTGKETDMNTTQEKVAQWLETSTHD